MFESAFERRLKDLAKRSGLKVAEVGSSSAKLMFDVGRHSQPLFILPFGNVWEFSCPSIIRVDRSEDFPIFILTMVLEINAKQKRGFWCIEQLGGKYTLEYMHNIPEALLTPDEFSNICWGIVKEVEALEEAFRETVRRFG